MEKLKLSYETLSKALKTLNKSIKNFEKLDKEHNWNNNNCWNNQIINPDELIEALRDSEIQRFEFCVDLFWKYIKKYLEYSLKKPTEINTPRNVILSACKAEIISELDASKIIDMIKDRNQTSHIYREEIAEELIKKIPEYYKLIYKYIAVLTP